MMVIVLIMVKIYLRNRVRLSQLNKMRCLIVMIFFNYCMKLALFGGYLKHYNY